VVSIGRCRSTTPVILTGTVHRPMELADPLENITRVEVLLQLPPRSCPVPN
jgi:hypothetical protein